MGKNHQLQQHIEQIEIKSKANPRKVFRVSKGFYFLTVDSQTWHITYCSEIKRWQAYVNKFLEADETVTKKEMMDCLLA